MANKKKALFQFALIQRLNELDRSQSWLAKQLHTDPCNISLYVSGKRVPRANTFLRICDILEIDPREVRFE
jgi:predicted transcriptional regulator